MPSRKGSPNRNKQFLLNRLQDMYGEDFHPIMRMAENAVGMQRIADDVPYDVDNPDTYQPKFSALKEAQLAWGRIAEYVEPKLKAQEIEVSGGEGKEPVRVKLLGVRPDNDG